MFIDQFDTEINKNKFCIFLNIFNWKSLEIFVYNFNDTVL